MIYTALLDACVLVPINLTDVLLRLARLGLFEPRWSERILEEVDRNLPRATPNIDRAKAAKRVAAMRAAFQDACVHDYEWLIPSLTNDPKDRHVLAAAVHCNARVLVTANLADFPRTELSRHGITPMHPDDFLVDLLEREPARVVQCLHEAVLSRRRPPESAESLLIQLGKLVPRFAEEAQRLPHLRAR